MAFLGLAFSLSPIASAQQFQTPTLPGPPPAAIALEIMQAKMAHAEALKAQMIRAQHEQGASTEFAKKAYDAQQTYLAEQAFLEYSAFLKKEVSSQFATTTPPANFTPVKRIPAPAQPAPTQPAPTQQAPAQQAAVEPPPVQPKTFAPPVHIAPRAEPDASLPQQTTHQQPPRSEVEPPISRSVVEQRQQAVGNQSSVPIAQRLGPAPVFQPNATTTGPRNRIAQAERKPRQPLYAPRFDRRRESLHTDSGGNDIGVRHAFETPQRMERTVQRRQLPPIRQASMFAPAQNPFNDQPMRLPHSSSEPELRAPQSNVGGSRSRRPLKQISILSSGRGPANQLRQDQGSGQQFNVPSEDRPTQPGQGLFGNNSPDELNKIDQELNRRMEELELPSGQGQRSRAEQMVDELDRQMQRSRDNDPGRRDPTLGEPGRSIAGERSSTQIVQKTCDEFRHELLNGSIRDISLDISPPASQNRYQYMAISRSWTDRVGNIIATGTMVDLRRGYVIIDGVEGQIKVPYSKLSDADWAAVSEYWRLPELCSVGHRGDASRCWIPQTHSWKASSLCHKPLFFENIQLERYGHSHGPFSQPVQSIGHFFVSLVTVPYQSAITPANECQYALGFYRPGNCAPWLKDPVPISLSGIGRQALVTTGLALIP